MHCREVPAGHVYFDVLSKILTSVSLSSASPETAAYYPWNACIIKQKATATTITNVF